MVVRIQTRWRNLYAAVYIYGTYIYILIRFWPTLCTVHFSWCTAAKLQAPYSQVLAVCLNCIVNVRATLLTADILLATCVFRSWLATRWRPCWQCRSRGGDVWKGMGCTTHCHRLVFIVNNRQTWSLPLVLTLAAFFISFFWLQDGCRFLSPWTNPLSLSVYPIQSPRYLIWMQDAWLNI